MKGSTATVDRRSSAVRRFALVAAVLAFAQGCSGGTDTVTQGQALYEANCLMCHGEGAQGDGPMAGGLPVPPPALFEHLGHHTRAHLIQLIGTGVPPAMPPTALDDEEIGLVVDYVWSLVPESQAAELRAMQEQMEMSGDSAMEAMPGMDMPGMEMPETDMPEMEGMDHSEHMPMETEQ